MVKTKSSNKDVLSLNYDASRGITICFLKDLYNDLSEDNAGIKKDIEIKDAFPAQVDDYVYNARLMETVKHLLSYMGEDV